MRKLLLLLVFVVSPLTAQDTVRVIHKNYITVFSKSLRYPILVEWSTTRGELECKTPAKRTDRFLPDPELRRDSDIDEDYVKSGFDRGHLSPAADARCNETHMAESFFFTNMAPQYPGLNRGQWKNLEEWTRVLAVENDSVHIQAGCVGEASRIKRVAVPTHCWKVIRFKNQTEAYVFPNVPERSQSFEIHKVPLDSVRRLTKLPIR
jgi:endonuclease G, mitochondrial